MGSQEYYEHHVIKKKIHAATLFRSLIHLISSLLVGCNETWQNQLKMDTKRIQSQGIAKSHPSRIFSPFRSVGNVLDNVPFAVGTLGSSFYIVTAIGRLFQIYDASTLGLLFVLHSQTDSRISCLAAHRHYVYAAYGSKVGVFFRGRLTHSLDCSHTIQSMCVFGGFLVVATAHGLIVVFKPNDTKYAAIEHAQINAFGQGEIVALAHPPTYLNKVVVALTDGIAIVNVRTGKVLFRQEVAVGVSCIEPAPVLDVVALGTVHGKVYLYHLKKACVLAEIDAANGAGVTSISFRSDGTPHFVASLNNGDMFFYDLNRMTRVHHLRNAHQECYGGVARVSFLAGQSILVSNGGDNLLKEYVFDPTLSTSNSAIVSPPRILRSRGGHSAPPTTIEFAQEDKTHFLYLASRDRSFWSLSLRKDAQAQEMSQRAPKLKDKKRTAGAVLQIREKLPEITCIALSQAREGEWANIVTVHAQEPFARTWDSLTKRLTAMQLHTPDQGMASLVCVSQCGNFGLVGSANGQIAAYNLQLGVMRKKYVLHKKAVTGIAIDGMNRTMVSAGLDGVVGFYDFSESKFLGKIQLDAAITYLKYHKECDLVAVALDDLSIVVIDPTAQRIVRVLYGHSNRITSLDILPDGRWIVLALLDASLRTWDIPTGGCIDGVYLPSVATTVRWLPLGDFLATTHVSGNGVSLWTNRAQFGMVSVRHVSEEEFATIDMPNVLGDGMSTILAGAFDTDEQLLSSQVYQSKNQIEGLTTLFLGGRQKYAKILHMDDIKRNNKPKEPVKKPEHAPFFLALLGEAVGDRALVAEGKAATLEKPQEDHESRLRDLGTKSSHSFESRFTSLLRENSAKPDFSEFIIYVMALPPSTIDLEIRSLSEYAPLIEMSNFIEALNQGLALRENYDMITALFAVLLKCHGDIIYGNPEDPIHQSLAKFRLTSAKINNGVDEAVKYCLGVLSLMQ